jgi:threonine dehydrogenase-like Zn-dependent dehydrogenase
LAGQTAWQGLFRHGGLKPGQSVLIHGGSGGVGHFAVQFAKAKEARVFPTVSTDNVDFAHSLGADVVIDYKIQRFEDHASDLDVVFDLAAAIEQVWPSQRISGAPSGGPWAKFASGRSSSRRTSAKVLLELGLGEKFQAKSSGWDENRTFLEGDVLEITVRNGRWVLQQEHLLPFEFCEWGRTKSPV